VQAFIELFREKYRIFCSIFTIKLDYQVLKLAFYLSFGGKKTIIPGKSPETEGKNPRENCWA